MVVATPTITNSVSFDKPKHFNTVMAFLTNMSCIPPDAFQACGRVRHPVSVVVHLYTASCLAAWRRRQCQGCEELRGADERGETARRASDGDGEALLQARQPRQAVLLQLS